MTSLFIFSFGRGGGAGGWREKAAEQGSLGAPGGKDRSGSAGVQESLQLQSGPSCGAAKSPGAGRPLSGSERC